MTNSGIRTVRLAQKSQLLPGLTPFAVGTLLYGTALVPLLPDVMRLPSLLMAFILMVGITVWMTLLSIRPSNHIARWRLILAPVALVAGGFLFHLLVGSAVGRFATLTLVMLFLTGFYVRADGLKPHDVEGLDSLLGMARTMTAVGLFFLTVFAFGISRFVQVPVMVSSLLVGAFQALVAFEITSGSSAERRVRTLAAVAVGVVSLELFVGMSFLPTPFLTNAAAVTVGFYALALSFGRALSGDFRPGRLRMGLALAGALVVVLLGTARWI